MRFPAGAEAGQDSAQFQAVMWPMPIPAIKWVDYMVPEVLPICDSGAVVVAGSIESVYVFLRKEGEMKNLKPDALISKVPV